MPDILLPPPADPPIGFVPTIGGLTTAAIQSAILAMTSAQVRAFLLAAGSVVQRSLSLTAAQINTLASVPIVLESFTGLGLPVGSVITPVWWTFEQRLGAVVFVPAPDLMLRYAGVAVNLCGNDLINNTALEYRYGLHGIPNHSLGVGVRASGKDLVLTAVADSILGSGTFLLNYGYQIMRGPSIP